MWTYLFFLTALSLAFLGRSTIWGVLAALGAAGLVFVIWQACATVALYPERLVVRPEGWPGPVLVFPLPLLVLLRAGAGSSFELLDRTRGARRLGPWVTLTGSEKGTRAKCEEIVEMVNEHLGSTSGFATSAPTRPAYDAIEGGGNVASNPAAPLPTHGRHWSRSRVCTLVVCYVSLPFAVFAAEWSGRRVVAAFSALLIFGIFQGLLRLAFHPQPSLARVLLALVFGALQVVAAPTAARAGTAAFRGTILTRLSAYEAVASARESKASNSGNSQNAVLLDPHPDVVRADIDDAGFAQLTLRHSLRKQRLVFARGKIPPPRLESGRCREQLATHWYWYVPCCSGQ